MSKKPVIKCLWCGRSPVPVKNGRIGSHLTPGGIRCVGVGQPSDTYQRHKEAS